jgi:hypothetical protein
MKTSSLKPSTKPLKRSPMSRGLTGLLSIASVQLSKRKPMKARRKSIPAHELAYFKRVAELPCVACGICGYSQAAHSNRYEDGKGARLKAHYQSTFPLCCTRPGEVGCHYRHDNCIGMTREEADERTSGYIAKTKLMLGVA